MDVGPAKLRRRATADVTRYEPVSLLMSRTQLATFDAFYTTTLLHGALTFEWTHPRTGNTVDARLTGAPTYTPAAPRQDGAKDKWRVEFGVEILPGTEVAAEPPPPPPPPPEPDPGAMVFEIEAGGGADAGDALAYEDAGEYGVPVPADDPFIAVYEESSGGGGDGGFIPSGDDGGGGFIEAPGSVGSIPVDVGSG